MTGEQERADVTPEQVQRFIEEFTAGIDEKLGDLAILSERHTDLSIALGQAREMLISLVKQHPEFQGASIELQVKLNQLERQLAALGRKVMRYSHLYEDAAVAAGISPS